MIERLGCTVMVAAFLYCAAALILLLLDRPKRKRQHKPLITPPVEAGDCLFTWRDWDPDR